VKKQHKSGFQLMLEKLHAEESSGMNFKKFLKTERIQRLITANQLFRKIGSREGGTATEVTEFTSLFRIDEFEVKVSAYDRTAFLAYKRHDPIRRFRVNSAGTCIEIDMLEKGIVIGNLIAENES